MTKNLKRKIERLERLLHIGRHIWRNKLRNLARSEGLNEEEFLAIVKGHEYVLTEEVGDDGLMTWEQLELMHAVHERGNVLRQARDGSSEPVTP